jgi:signal transduction histidine kinase
MAPDRATATARSGLSIRFRLTLVYTAVAMVGVAVIFGLTFLSLYRTLQQDELRDMQQRLLSYWAQFQTGGVELLQEQIRVDNLVVGERPFVVRIADRTNETLFFSYPEVWESFSVSRLEVLPLDPGHLHVLTSPDYEFTIEVGGLWLSDDVYLQLGLSTETRTRLLALFRRNFVLIAAAVAVAGFVVGLVVAGRAFRPIARVTRVAREIVETGRLDARVETGAGAGELTQLVNLINRMLDRINRLVDGMRNTVDMVAHDLRTPITRLRAQAELALRDGSPEEMENALAGTVEQSDEILRLVNTLLDITEAESGVMRLNYREFPVAPLLQEVYDLYEMVAEERRITLKVNAPADLAVEADRLRLRQVVTNLVDNALKFCRENGTVRLAAEPADTDQGRCIRIRVSDTGPGLDPDERERVWERMYRGPVQPEQPGLGLGLSLVRAVTLAHGGRAWVESERGNGAEFIVEFPERRGR